MDTKIYSHDADVDVTHKTNTTELLNWISHLKYIHKELHNLINLCGEDLINELKKENILSEFDEKDNENETLLSTLTNYLSVRENIAECEDTQCDMVFITEHETYRKTYLNHLNEYRNIKDKFYVILKGKLSLLHTTP
jgi:hypothetical protein